MSKVKKPIVDVCLYCEGLKGDIKIVELTEELAEKLPKRFPVDDTPCEECFRKVAEHNACMLIEVDEGIRCIKPKGMKVIDGEVHSPTGNYAITQGDIMSQIIDKESYIKDNGEEDYEDMITKRFHFLSNETFSRIVPRGNHSSININIGDAEPIILEEDE